MELTFLGRGGAFNPKEGNNAAYFTDHNQLFLIDCGENIFERLVKKNILTPDKTINVMITHTHSDHIGSLGSLVLYLHYNLGRKLNIIIPENSEYQANIEQILQLFGCTKEMYNFTNEKNYDYQYITFNSLRYIKTTHCKEIESYGLIFTTNKGLVYYSGDTNETNIIKALLDSKEPIDKIYIDTTTANFQGNVHLYIGILEKIIPKELKQNVYCMHLNSNECITKAKKIGFNVVKINK